MSTPKKPRKRRKAKAPAPQPSPAYELAKLVAMKRTFSHGTTFTVRFSAFLDSFEFRAVRGAMVEHSHVKWDGLPKDPESREIVFGAACDEAQEKIEQRIREKAKAA